MTRIDTILTMVPTAAYKTLVLFEKHGGISLTISSDPVGVWGWVSAVDSEGRTIWIVDAHRGGKRFIVRADEKLTSG